jgi:hypothetical protein
MIVTRRNLIITSLVKFSAVAALLSAGRSARACLVGTWKVRCPNGHVDTVSQVTCNHNCETCGTAAVSNGEGNIVCPAGHVNHVVTGDRDHQDSWIRSHTCATEGCGRECCVQQSQQRRRDPQGPQGRNS